MGFVEKYLAAKEGKNSVICAGIDPVSQFMNPGEKAIDRRYFEDSSEVEGMFNFCLDTIRNVSEHCCAIKPNMQFVMPFSIGQYRKMNALAHEKGLVSILDNKLGDIGSSNRSSFYWAKQAGFDALTFSPFAGNIMEATEAAHEAELGIIVLTLMTNPDAKYFMRDAMIGGAPGHLWIAEGIGKAGADGAVVGATHTRKSEVRGIRERMGKEAVILIPGIGAQGGDLTGTISAFGKNILVNVGRSVLYSNSQKESARGYKEMLNKLMGVG